MCSDGAGTPQADAVTAVTKILRTENWKHFSLPHCSANHCGDPDMLRATCVTLFLSLTSASSAQSSLRVLLPAQWKDAWAHPGSGALGLLEPTHLRPAHLGPHTCSHIPGTCTYRICTLGPKLLRPTQLGLAYLEPTHLGPAHL